MAARKEAGPGDGKGRGGSFLLSAAGGGRERRASGGRSGGSGRAAGEGPAAEGGQGDGLAGVQRVGTVDLDEAGLLQPLQGWKGQTCAGRGYYRQPLGDQVLVEFGSAHQAQQVGEVRRGQVRQLTLVPGASRVPQGLKQRGRRVQAHIATGDGFGQVAHHPCQTFQQRLVRRDLAVAELVQAPQVIGDFGLFAGQVAVRFRQGGQIRGKQSVGVMALQLLAGVAGQRVDAVVQCVAGSQRARQQGPVGQRYSPASAASRALRR